MNGMDAAGGVVDGLGGALWFRPGWPRPHNLRSTRPDWVDRITRGRPVSQLPATLGRLFGLCGHAHLGCATIAVKAALGEIGSEGPTGADTDDPVDAGTTPCSLRARNAEETMREHVQRLFLDWPQRLAIGHSRESAVAGAGTALARCPLFASSRTAGALTEWMQAKLFGMPAAAWLAEWERDPAGWLHAWSLRTEGEVPRLLRDWRAPAHRRSPSVPALQVHADAPALRVLASRLTQEGGRFARRPTWDGGCAETGVWTRLNDTSPMRLDTAWLRLGARLAELVRLALPDQPGRSGAVWLDIGTRALGPGESIAWVEMARGLLLHHLQLDGRGESARVASCQVIAPTEWNFHPDGAVARTLEQLPRAFPVEEKRRLDLAIAAYDPCVPCRQDHWLPDSLADA